MRRMYPARPPYDSNSNSKGTGGNHCTKEEEDECNLDFFCSKEFDEACIKRDIAKVLSDWLKGTDRKSEVMKRLLNVIMEKLKVPEEKFVQNISEELLQDPILQEKYKSHHSISEGDVYEIILLSMKDKNPSAVQKIYDWLKEFFPDVSSPFPSQAFLPSPFANADRASGLRHFPQNDVNRLEDRFPVTSGSKTYGDSSNGFNHHDSSLTDSTKKPNDLSGNKRKITSENDQTKELNKEGEEFVAYDYPEELDAGLINGYICDVLKQWLEGHDKTSQVMKSLLQEMMKKQKVNGEDGIQMISDYLSEKLIIQERYRKTQTLSVGDVYETLLLAVFHENPTAAQKIHYLLGRDAPVISGAAYSLIFPSSIVADADFKSGSSRSLQTSDENRKNTPLGQHSNPQSSSASAPTDLIISRLASFLDAYHGIPSSGRSLEVQEMFRVMKMFSSEKKSISINVRKHFARILSRDPRIIEAVTSNKITAALVTEVAKKILQDRQRRMGSQEM